MKIIFKLQIDDKSVLPKELHLVNDTLYIKSAPEYLIDFVFILLSSGIKSIQYRINHILLVSSAY